MKIALCDDDKDALKLLYDLSALYFSEKMICAEILCFSNAEKLLLNLHGLDLLFLDIDMPEMDGIALAKKIRTKDMDIKIIFATNYKKYLYYAFTVHPFGYIVKPVTQSAVFNNLDDFMKSQQNSCAKKLIVLTKGKTQILLLAEEVFYFEYCAGLGIKAVKINGCEYIHMTLSEIFKQSEVYDFTYCHKGCIVNLEYIKRIKGLEIQLSNGAILPLAQKRASVFRKIHHDFLQRRSQG